MADKPSNRITYRFSACYIICNYYSQGWIDEYRNTGKTPVYRAAIKSALPYDEADDQCIKSFATIYWNVESSNKDLGRILAIPVGITVLARYFPAFGGLHFIWDRIFFDLIKESKTKARVKIRHNLEKGLTLKIQKEPEKMKKIEDHLRQWEGKLPYENNKL